MATTATTIRPTRCLVHGGVVRTAGCSLVASAVGAAIS
jgi:hypothetical protein